MVDVRVRFASAPLVWVGSKVLRHVFVNFFLEVDSGASERPDDDISAHPAFTGHITAWIFEPGISRIVLSGVLRLVYR
jgi:hypothetical protein